MNIGSKNLSRFNAGILFAALLVIGGLIVGVWSSPRSAEAQIASATPLTVKDIASTDNNNCMIASNGQAYCWGNNGDGQLGNNSTTQSLVPVAVDTSGVLSGKTILSISTRSNHTCAIASDNLAYCWGNNASGQLGNNSTTPSLVPVAVDTSGVLAGKTMRAISVGALYTCAIASDSQAYCWGSGGTGRLGNNTATQSNVPVAVNTTGVLSGKTIRSISTGTNGHTCAVASDNRAYCWGYNSSGQLGNNSTTQSNVPVAVNTTGVLSGKTIRSVSVGMLYACAIASDNQVYCWGNNTNGKLGNNSTAQSLVPVAVTTTGALSGKTIRSVATGNNHACVYASDNLAYCWGDNTNGQLGNNSTTQSSVPVAVTASGALSGKTVKAIAAGINHTCAIASDSQTYCWGSGDFGKLGNNSTAQSLVPVATSLTYLRITISQSVYRLYNSSTTATPGAALAVDNTAGTIGQIAGQFRMRIGITNLSDNLLKAESISAGLQHTCAIGSDNQAYCWGLNDNGQLGTGNNTNMNVPTKVNNTGVLAGKTIRQISSGYFHTCVIASDNQAYCWGKGDAGRLGNNSTTSTSNPVAVTNTGVLAGKTILQIASGNSHTCVIASDNNVYCWGEGAYGQLGNNLATNSSVPVAVSTSGAFSGKTVKQISASEYYNCAVASDNQAYCWGLGNSGRLGNNATTAQIVPVAVNTSGVLSGKTVQQVATSSEHACVIASDGYPYCWGANDGSRLGNGSTTNSSVPVAVTRTGVLSGKIAQSLYAGTAHTCVIASDNQSYCWGYNDEGEYGNNTMTTSSTPVATTPVVGSTWRTLALGYYHSCGINNESKIYCWGTDDSGQLAMGQTAVQRLTPSIITRGSMLDTSTTINSSQLSMKLQVRPRGAAATCSAATSSWVDISGSSSISFGTAPPANGAAISAYASDPLAPTIAGFVYQSIVQSGTSFSNSSAIISQQTGLWDFVLKDSSSTSAANYCFRVLPTAASDSIDNYVVQPEVKTATGSLGIRFIDGSNNEISGTATNTAFTSRQISSSVQSSTGQFTNNTSKYLEIYNSLSNTGWSVSLAATAGPTARWTSGANNYPYNATASAGRLSVDMTTSTISPNGTTPSGTACNLSGVTGSSSSVSYANGTVDAITLLNGASLAGFNCSWRMQNIQFIQTIPTFQPSGAYELDLTATVVAQ